MAIGFHGGCSEKKKCLNMNLLSNTIYVHVLVTFVKTFSRSSNYR